MQTDELGQMTRKACKHAPMFLKLYGVLASLLALFLLAVIAVQLMSLDARDRCVERNAAHLRERPMELRDPTQQSDVVLPCL